MPSDVARRWLDILWPELTKRRPELERMNDYYIGNHPLPFLTKAHQDKTQSEFRRLLEESRSNFMRLVVDVVEERLRVEGFRLSASTDPRSDKDTWDIWQANQLDSESQVAFVDALVKGRSYLSVWAGDPYPTVAVEDPLETIVAYEGGSGYRRRAAALKTWKDEYTGLERANVYLPDGIYKYVSSGEPGQPALAPAYAAGTEDSFGEPMTLRGKVAQAVRTYTSRPQASPNAAWDELPDNEFFVENPVGVVPIIPLRNRPRLLVEGESELSDVWRVQDQMNGLTFLLAMAGYFGAHRQRWATAFDVEADANGRYPEPFNTAVDRFWWSNDPDTKFGEFEQTDLTQYIKAIEQKTLHIAVTTRTPRHYLIEQGQSPSGDAIRSAESGLVKKVERKQRTFGEGLEEALRLARQFGGAGDAPVDSEIVWADAATLTIAETTDAVIKQYGAGLIPWETAAQKLGYSQTEIARMSVERQSDALLQALANPVGEEPELEPAVE